MLNERQLLILQKIIDDFIETAHPIGSRALSKKEGIDLSAATVRNVMADLEDLGLLEKTHTSSGRIPSQLGYRHYVDHLIMPSISKANFNKMKKILVERMSEKENIVQLSAELLSELTNYTSIVLGPNNTNTKLKQLQIVSLSQDVALLILITNTGHVEHQKIKLHPKISFSDIEKVINILNEKLIGVSINQLRAHLDYEVLHLLKSNVENYHLMYEELQSTLEYQDNMKIYVGGSANMMIQPEFQDVKKMYEFYTMLEKEDELIKMLMNYPEDLTVTIGDENQIEAIKNFSLITMPLELHRNQMGTIALIGPTRMEYRRVMSILRALSHELKDLY